MIQRIQTVWLFLAALFAGLSYKFPFYTGNVINKENVHLYEKLVASSNFSCFDIYCRVSCRNDLYNIYV
jgi:hypothetical protein